jgi:hypothetical protein
VIDDELMCGLSGVFLFLRPYVRVDSVYSSGGLHGRYVAGGMDK